MNDISEQKILKILSDSDEVFTAVKNIAYKSLNEDEVITNLGFNPSLKIFVVIIENNKEVSTYTMGIDEVIEELINE